MTARFHINSIDEDALARAGYYASILKGGEVELIYTARGPLLQYSRGNPDFERILLACMNKPRLAVIGGADNSGMSEG